MAFCRKAIGEYAQKSFENKEMPKFLCFCLIQQMLGLDHKAVMLPKSAENTNLVCQEGLAKKVESRKEETTPRGCKTACLSGPGGGLEGQDEEAVGDCAVGRGSPM